MPQCCFFSPIPARRWIVRPAQLISTRASCISPIGHAGATTQDTRCLFLSARHDFLDPLAEIDPYDQRMTPQRADEVLDNFPAYLQQVAWPARVYRERRRAPQ